MRWLATDHGPIVEALLAAGEEVVVEAWPDDVEEPADYPLARHLARHDPDVLLCLGYDRPPGLPKGAALVWRRDRAGRRIVGSAAADPRSYADQLAGRRRGCAVPLQALDVYLTTDEQVAAQAARSRRVVLEGRPTTVQGLLEALAARLPGIYPAS